MRGGSRLKAKKLAKGLQRAIEGEVYFDEGNRALYATDASNYRQVPIGVIRPRTPEDVVAAIEVCRRLDVPVLARGGGTSLAGQCCNVAVVFDFSRHLSQILELNPEGRFARVQPGVVLDQLRAQAERFGLTFGPDPSTHNHCTLGGMIGNNSCGVHSVYAGRTSENVLELTVLTYDGQVLKVGATPQAELADVLRQGGRRAEIYRGLANLAGRYAEEIRARFPRIPRRVSGYPLEELLPENGFHVGRALCGTEGTCVMVLEAKVRLVDSPPARSLLVLGYPDVFSAADHIEEVLAANPIGLEGLDDVLVDHMHRKHLHVEYADLLPEGGGWLMAEFGGATKEESDAKAKALIVKLSKSMHPPSFKLFDDPKQEEHLWHVRESGLGATARVPGEPDTWEGWEDSAVHPHRLGTYLRELKSLFRRYDYGGALYGHFGQGCVHTRINFDLSSKEGIARYRAFVQDAADLVVRLGGSLSGEHGDGQSRAELLPKMYGPSLVRAFEVFKGIWDPLNRMNPGKVVHPHRLDQDLRLGPGFRPASPATYFKFPDDKGSLGYAAMRCVGIGECRREEKGTMCPSFRATHEEKHSTRGRAHLLFEMLQGGPVRGGWRDRHVKEALDLCLSCKGCKSDCPMNVDLATYKAEFLAHYYRRRLRPRAAYSMGLIHWWAKLATAAPEVFNFVTHAKGLSSAFKRLGGIEPTRQVPRFAPRTFRASFRRMAKPAGADGRAVLLWPDTFNDHFHPQTLWSAADVLAATGVKVLVPPKGLCCGRPLFDWGMLPLARRLLRRCLTGLRPYLDSDLPMVVLEPSCAAVFRDELLGLFPDEPLAKKLAERTRLFAEYLEDEAKGFALPELTGPALVQGHCHQKAVLGMGADEAVLGRLGLSYQLLDSGCCGMAGSFGYERGERYRVSKQVGERVLLPAVRRAGEDALIIADGFSCRSQIEQETGRRALHLAEVVQAAMCARPRPQIENSLPAPASR